uniref:hypothetical protein n=1 Tax=Penaeicola halotolerans TaxID=2793196 RepID=UPI001CF8F83D
LKRLNLAWNFVATNRICNAVLTRSAGIPVANTFVPIDTLTGQPLEVRPFDAANFPLIFREAQNGARHTVPISASFNLHKR